MYLPNSRLSGLLNQALQRNPACASRPLQMKAWEPKRHQATGTFGAHSVAEFKVGAMIDAAGPGQVIIDDNSGAPVSSWGSLVSLAAKIKGIAGTIIDGGARDVKEIRDCGYAVQARHIVPTRGRKRIKVEGIGVPIEVSGVGINPAEIVRIVKKKKTTPVLSASLQTA